MLLTSNNTTFLVQIEFKLICARDFFKKFKFNSHCKLIKFWYFLKNSLMQINSKLHSKSYDYLYLKKSKY